ncbi:MAG: DUF1778 domain-containing protein [Acidobacteriaceae bacterium]|nr:DUF1778 domain-containing protein [Acidobacteriaceae bacterium]
MAAVVEPRIRRTTANRPKKRVEKRAALNMRIRPELRDLIDQAAEITGKNRTDFMLDAARQAAHTTLLDQTQVRFSPAAFAEFLKLLDAPAQPNQLLRRSLLTKAPWE